LDESEPYDVYFPFNHGHIHRRRDKSEEEVLSDIQDILEYVITQKIRISLKNISVGFVTLRVLLMLCVEL